MQAVRVGPIVKLFGYLGAAVRLIMCPLCLWARRRLRRWHAISLCLNMYNQYTRINGLTFLALTCPHEYLVIIQPPMAEIGKRQPGVLQVNMITEAFPSSGKLHKRPMMTRLGGKQVVSYRYEFL